MRLLVRRRAWHLAGALLAAALAVAPAGAEDAYYRPPEKGMVLTFATVAKSDRLRDLMRPQKATARHRIVAVLDDRVAYELHSPPAVPPRALQSYRGIFDLDAAGALSPYRLAVDAATLAGLWPLAARTRLEIAGTWSLAPSGATGRFAMTLRVDEPETIETPAGRFEVVPIVRLVVIKDAAGAPLERHQVRAWFAPRLGWTLREDAIVETRERKARFYRTLTAIDPPLARDDERRASAVARPD